MSKMLTVGDPIIYSGHTYTVTLALHTAYGIGVALAHGGGQEYLTATLSDSGIVQVSMPELHYGDDRGHKRFAELVTELVT